MLTHVLMSCVYAIQGIEGVRGVLLCPFSNVEQMYQVKTGGFNVWALHAIQGSYGEGVLQYKPEVSSIPLL